MKKLLALALAAIMAISMVACGGGEETKKTKIDEILEQGYITCAISPDFAPTVFKDPKTGEIMGTDVEYAKYVADYIGKKYGKTIELKIEELDFTSCMVAVSTNNVHFSVNGFALTDERKQNFIGAGPYGIIPEDENTFHGALVKIGSGFDPKTAEDFKGKKIGTQQASLQYELAKNQLPVDEMPDFEFVKDLAVGAMMVKTDKIDALITDSGAGNIMISNNPELKMAEFKLVDTSGEGTYALVNIDEVELGELINEAILDAERNLNYVEIREEMTNVAKSFGLEINE